MGQGDADMMSFNTQAAAALTPQRDGIHTQFKEVSIVEIGFMGNVLREFYRIGLADGAAYDTTSGKAVRMRG